MMYSQPVRVQQPPQQNWTALPRAPQQQVQVPKQQLPPPPPATPQPRIARGNGYDAPAPTPAPQPPAPLSLPAPEQLGVGRPAAASFPAEVDWNAAHAELRRLGAVGVQFTAVPGGGYRFAFQLPTADPNRTRHVDATGVTESEAVYTALRGARQP
jgi:hypothetical protein